MPKHTEVEDDEFDEIVAEKRHEELSSTLKTIASHLSKRNDDSAVVKAINDQGGKVAELVKVIEKIPMARNPTPNLEASNDKFLHSINQISKDIIESNNKVIASLENRLLPDTFELVKGYGGVTTSVKVNYKPANKLI